MHKKIVFQPFFVNLFSYFVENSKKKIIYVDIQILPNTYYNFLYGEFYVPLYLYSLPHTSLVQIFTSQHNLNCL